MKQPPFPSVKPTIEIERFLHTDQTQCFDQDGHPIDCCNSGQDGRFGSTQPPVVDRFVNVGPVVEDHWSGLFWTRKADIAAFPLTWEEAAAFVQEMNRCQRFGRTDWRLPTRRELFGLISHQHINPALPSGHPFRDVFNGYYWTSTPCARLPDQAWYLHMGGARIYRGMKHGSYMVWPVAGPSARPSTGKDRFVAQTDSFYDRLTGRSWLNNQWLDNEPATWQAALDRVAALNHKRVGGYGDWRLPNIRELESLIDVTAHSPAFSPACPLSAVMEGYWSSTTSIYEPRYAWVLYTQDGAVGVGFKVLRDFHVLAVRCAAHHGMAV